MCFGNDVKTEQKTTQSQLPEYLRTAAQSNVANAASLTSQPFQSYTGPRVAGLSQTEQQGGDLLRAVAGSDNPYLSDIEGLYGRFGNTPGATISSPSILGPNTDVRTASLTDYMSPYIMAALQPQLDDISKSGAAARKRIGTEATFGGAFGDARHGIEAANQIYDENRLRTNTIGTGYNTAFNTAAGLRGQDISNLFNADKATADYNEAALARAKGGGDALLGLDKYTTGRGVDLSKALSDQGAKERGVEQAGLDANFQEFMRQQGYAPEMIKLFTSVLAGTPHEGTSVATTEKPDNSGYGILGSLASALPYLLL